MLPLSVGLPGCLLSWLSAWLWILQRDICTSQSFSLPLCLASLEVARGRSAFSGGLARRQRLLDRAPPSRPPQLCRGW